MHTGLQEATAAVRQVASADGAHGCYHATLNICTPTHTAMPLPIMLLG
jgi:hypothetical protein